jgi:hypothetical protein
VYATFKLRKSGRKVNMKSVKTLDTRLLRKSVIAGSLLATAASVVSISGCATTDETFQVVIGAKFASDVLPCADYASYYNNENRRYNNFNPYSKKLLDGMRAWIFANTLAVK